MSDGSVVLYIGDDDTRSQELGDTGEWRVEHVETVSEAREQMAVVDCLVIEQALPDGSGLDLCRTVRELHPDLPVVLVPETGTDELARQAVAVAVDEYVPASTISDPGELRAVVADTLSSTAIDRRRYRKLVEQTTDVISVVDPDGTVQYVSPAIEDLLGYTPAELVGTDVFAYIHPADSNSIRVAFDELLESSGETFAREFRLERADGSIGWAEARARNFVDDPAIGGVVISTREITARKDREELYSTLVEEANDGILIIQDGDIQFLNNQMATLLDSDRETIAGESVLQFVAPADRTQVAVDFQKRLQGDGTTSRFDIDVQTVTGDHVPVEVSTSLVNYRGSTAELAIVRDITARKARQRELELYETMLNAVPDMVYAIDEDGYFLDINETFSDEMGLDREAVLGRHVSLGMTEADVRTGEEHIRDLLTDDHREKAIYEMTFHPPDGEPIPVENHVALLEAVDGTVRGSVGVLRDITDRNRSERRLTVLNRALRHDLRNSMHVILANAELVERTTDDPEIERKLRTIQRRAEDINSLSEKAREIEQTVGERTLPRRRIDLASVLTDQTTRFREQYPDATIETEIPDHAWVDAIELVDVAVENLIENSIEHTAAEHVAVAVDVTGDTVSVTVADDGSGVPESERRVISQGSETPLDHARGLGLWLVTWITRDSGGEVVFEDGDDGGVVRLVFDRADPEPERDDSETGARAE